MSAHAEKARAALPDPRAALWPNYNPPTELVFTHGVGSELFAEDGSAYLDFLSGIAVTSFGHAHPHLLKALEEQANKLWHTSNVFRIPGSEALAQRLAEACFADRVYFANSGTEAVEAGIKAIRGYQTGIGHSEKFRIIGFTESFHGRTLAALAAAGNENHMRNFVPGDYGFDQAEWENSGSVEQLIGENTAGIILEPVQGEGGIRSITADFLEAVRELCNKHGLLLMLDEVQCGIGRTGKLFAHEHYDVTPDVMAVAKGLGGGFPVGACLTTEAVGQAMQFGTHGSTFGGNPLAAAVANGVLDLVLEPGLLDQVNENAAYLQNALKKLTQQYPVLIESVHGLGLMLGVKCVVPNADLLIELRKQKLLVGKAGSNMVRLLPPLNVSRLEIDRAVAAFANALSELASR